MIFVAGRDIHNLNPAIQKLTELYPKIETVVIGSTGVYPLSKVDGFKIPFISVSDIKNLELDLVLVTGGSDDINGLAPDVHFANVLTELKSANIPESKILLDRVLCIPQFSFEKYEKLKKSKPTIFAMNCFGGVIYHRFGLPFYSPMINMFLEESDMLKFLRDPMVYINTEIKFYKTYSAGIGGGYPLFTLNDDVVVNMNHYGELGADFAKNKWEDRKKRINWYNIIPVIFTSSPEVLEEFDDFPFAKKICFTSFSSKKDSAYYLDKKLDDDRKLGDLVNRFGLGYNHYNYDLWDMFLYGKKSFY